MSAQYRADLDGLRAVAVLAVLAFHAYPGALPGGFVGVDVFFVLSGFLISRLLFDEVDAGGLALADFYARRIRRLFPALALVLAAALAAGAILLLPSEWALVGKHVAGAAAFVDNSVFWSESGYFDRAAAAKPLLHLWSLGVEEQFYLVWPLLVWAAGPDPRRRRLSLAAVAGLSFLANLALLRWDATAAFFWPLSRFWELGSGGLLATVSLRRTSRVAAPLGLVAILAASALFRPSMPYPGWGAVVPVAGSLLLIASGRDTWLNRRLLAHPAAALLGRISYPLYLWHWPLLSFATILRAGRPPTALEATVLLAASLALSILTYRFAERPIRFGAHKRRSTGLAAGAMVLVFVAGVLVWREEGFPARLADLPALQLGQIAAAAAEPIFAPTPSMRVDERDGVLIARLGAGPPAALLEGDSELFHYAPRAQRLFEQHRLSGTLTFVVGAGCPPVPGVFRLGKFAHCRALPGLAATELAHEPGLSAIVIGAAWEGYLVPGVTVERDGKRFPAETPSGTAAFFANLADEIRSQAVRGRHVYLILSGPADPSFEPAHLVARSWRGVSVDRQALAGVALSRLHLQTARADAALRAVAAETGATLLDPVPDICGPGPLCAPFYADGRPKFDDTRHLNTAFVRDRISFLDPIFTAPPARP